MKGRQFEDFVKVQTLDIIGFIIRRQAEANSKIWDKYKMQKQEVPTNAKYMWKTLSLEVE